MKHSQITYVGGIFFFVGLILMLISWHFTYPIHMPELDEIIFTQFYPFIWPGLVLSLMGLFLAGYYSKRKSVKAICASFFPVVLYAHSFYFSYIPTSDSGAVRAMFEVFHHTGINPAVESYFYYPIYFTLNEMTSQIFGLGADGLATIFFALFGVLLALYLYLFLFKTTENDCNQIAFLAVPLYFIAIFTYLNYQWVPQTLALVFLLLLLILFDQKKTEYKLLSIIIFTVLVFTHLFIPAIFLLFLGITAIKKREFRNIFLLMTSIYVLVLTYYATFYLPVIIDAFRQSIYGFGEEYTIDISRSFMEPIGLASQIISTINRIRIPLVWIVISIGFFIGFIKRKINFSAVALGITGSFYFGVGMFYSVLGTRALQILFIPLVIGIGFFIAKWKKPTLVFVTIIIILSVFGPIRDSYDDHQFQLNEERSACNFLANTMSTEQSTKLAIGGVNSGYFLKKFIYVNMDKNYHDRLWVLVPRNPEFYSVFNTSTSIIKQNDYMLYNPNLGKEIISYGYCTEETCNFKELFLSNNKIYECGKTFIVKKRPNADKGEWKKV